ncbi:leucine rich repeat containing 51 [Lampris incognitus]|uniref:leucine rich repeat containing 51 n=1 Tax=Lampris incognitus TaxID=2546036 RepID=UPI0024B50831|nr:leucine rich repeat containing 51 [Lampris incognitus]
MCSAPVDLSFKCIGSLEDALTEEPSAGLRPLKRDATKKYVSRSLRLSNNIISDLSHLHAIINHFLAEPSRLAWVDLSFNDISNIDPVLCELHELRILYLHGNNLCSLMEVDRLGVLPSLHTVTLHGNSIENVRGYRSHVISVLPHLKMMDFSAVTPTERDIAQILQHRHNRKKAAQRGIN